MSAGGYKRYAHVCVCAMRISVIQGKSQAEIIQGSYANAKAAFNEYVRVTNQGLTLELNPLKSIS